MRTLPLSLTLCLVACGGSVVPSQAPTAETQQPVPEALALNESFAPKLEGECRKGFETDGAYGCDADKGDVCPFSMDDIRDKDGFHFINAVQCACGTHPRYVHVADSCQHYFCGVDQDCIKKGGTAEGCMVTEGCMLVHKL